MLIYRNESIWSFVEKGAIGIPTNGFITKKGLGVMGAGLALDAKNRYPGIAENLGNHLKKEGNQVGWLQIYPHRLVVIPVKPSFLKIESADQKNTIIPKAKNLYRVGDIVPGYHCLADLNLIEKSLNQLVTFIEKKFNSKNVYSFAWVWEWQFVSY